MDVPLIEYYQVKLPLKIAEATKSHLLNRHKECGRFCKNSASFLIDFIDTARTIQNFIRRTKVIPSFFKERDRVNYF